MTALDKHDTNERTDVRTKISISWAPIGAKYVRGFHYKKIFDFPGMSAFVQMIQVTLEPPLTVDTIVSATPHPSAEVRRTAPSSLQSMGQEGETA